MGINVMIGPDIMPDVEAVSLRGARFFSGPVEELDLPEHSHEEIQVAMTGDKSSVVLNYEDRSGRRVEAIAEPNTVSVIASNAAHAARWQSPDVITTLYLSPSVFFARYPECLGLTPILETAIGQHDGFLCSMLKQMIPLHEATTPLERAMTENLIETIGLHLVTRYGTISSAAPNPSSACELRRTPIKKALDIIEARFREAVSVDAICEEVGMSRAHFIRCFSDEVGLPPYRYIMMRRLAEATYLLRHSDLQISQIAFDVGFGSSGRFTHEFSKKLGVSPTQYRLARR
ncbi:MAG: AraC family transcriptional regulator [Pseudomonadota bacterium]